MALPKLDIKKPHGTISGDLESAPGARYVQNRMYFDARGRYIVDADGTDRKLEEGALIPPGTPDGDTIDLDSILKHPSTRIAPYLIPLSDDEVQALLVYAREHQEEKGISKAVIVEIELENAERVGAPGR